MTQDASHGNGGNATGIIHASFAGEPITAPAGSSVAAALINAGHTAWRETRGGEPRGIFCGIGVCFDCIVEIDGESGQRACMIPLEAGMRICPAPTAQVAQADQVASPATHTSDISEPPHE